MDQYVILEILKLKPPTVIQFHKLELGIWGRDLKFMAQANEIDFGCYFLECRETRWQHYSHKQHADNPAFPITELANFKQGRDQHRSPAHLLTDHFGLSVVYGKLQIVVGDVIYDLGG